MAGAMLDPQGLAGELRERLLGPEASPTVEDTAELKKLLAAHGDDLGVRQLHLHWLDQAPYRKLYPQEIADAASKVLALLEGGGTARRGDGQGAIVHSVSSWPSARISRASRSACQPADGRSAVE